MAKGKTPVQENLSAIQKMIPEDAARASSKDLIAAAELATQLQTTAPWCADTPKELFQQYVLCPRVGEEELTFHQNTFYQMLWPEVRSARSAPSAAQRVNRWCAAHAKLVPGTETVADPWTVYRTGFGNSMELAVFVAYCMRCVGLAARVVSVPYWSHMDGGYAWIEFLNKRTWGFMEPCTPSPFYNSGWFQDITSRAMLVQVKTFGPTKSPLHGELVETIGNVTVYNQNSRYMRNTDLRGITVREGRNPCAGATVRLQIINGGALRTIAELRSDDFGRVFFTAGHGELWVSASKDGYVAEGISKPGEDLWLNITDAVLPDNRWTDAVYSVIPAFAAFWKSMPEDRKKEEEQLLAAAAEKRAAWEKELTAPAAEENLPKSCADLLEAARGNRAAIARFLRDKGTARREKFLRTLPAADLRTASAEMLESHFAALPPQNLPDGIYWRYVACPRIRREKLFAWRDPKVCAAQASSLSEAERTVLDLRRKGIPARLRPLDGAPERWEKNAFRAVEPEESGTVEISCSQELPSSLWSLSRLEDGASIPLDLSEYRWKAGSWVIPLPCGIYRLVAALRTPAGNHKYTLNTFSVQPKATVYVRLPVLQAEPSRWLQNAKLPYVSASTLRLYYENIFGTGKPAMYLWLEQMDGATVRLLEDIRSCRLEFWHLFDACYLMMPKDCKDKTRLTALASSAFPGTVPVDGYFTHEAIVMAASMGLELGRFPLLGFGDGYGTISYAQAGFQEGTADAQTILRARRACTGQTYRSCEASKQGKKPSWADDPIEPIDAQDAPPKLELSHPAVRKAIQALQGDRPPQTDGELLRLLQQMVDGVWRRR